MSERTAAARRRRLLAHIEACGGVFTQIPNFSDWFEAAWRDPANGEDWRFAARLGSKENWYARAFQVRAGVAS